MRAATEPPGMDRWARARDRVGLLVAWGTWLAMTVWLVLYVRGFSRDVPFMDEFDLVPALTGASPLTLDWAWSQHHEHRPLISRLILVGLARFVHPDFRTARYANVALLSLMAAMTLILARRIRGSARLTDAVLPLSILSLAQAESLMIGFATNLILTSMLAVGLIVAAGLSRGEDGRAMMLTFGLSMVALPLCGGSGLAMLPPLGVWLAGYLARGWWSGRPPGASTRAIGAALLLASAAIVVLYLHGYTRPPYHPLASSPMTVADASLKYLSLSIYPKVDGYWWPAGPIVLVLLIATLWLLVGTAARSVGDRPRSLGLVAVILSMLGVAGALGVARGGLGPSATMLSRYITLASPLLAAIYIAWLAYGRPTAQVVVHVALLALVISTVPGNHRFSRVYGRPIRQAARRVEWGLKSRAPAAILLDRACPTLFPDRAYALGRFQMLKAAGFGEFAAFDPDGGATDSGDVSVRR